MSISLKRAAICVLLLAALFMAGCNSSLGPADRQKITNDTWMFYADSLMEATVVKRDAGNIAAYLPLFKKAYGTTLNVKDDVSDKYVKLMVRVRTSKDAMPAEGQTGYKLGARVNGGKWLYMDISAYLNGDTHWIDLPVDRSKIKKGENRIEICSTLESGVFLCATSVDGEAYGYELTADDKQVPLSDFQPCIRLKYDAPSKDSSKWQPVKVPGAFEKDVRLSIKDEVKANDFNGVGWYRYDLKLPQKKDGKDIWLSFDAVDYIAEVWLNGHFIGSHEGGYTPFKFNLSRAQGDIHYGRGNELIVRVVDQSLKQGVRDDQIYIKETLAGFLQDTRGLNYGGIWQDVYLEQRGIVYVDDVFIDTDVPGKTATAIVTLGNSGDMALEADVEVTIKEGSYKSQETVTVKPGTLTEFRVSVTMETVKLWSIKDPNLYTALVTVTTPGSEDTESVRFGMRTLETDGAKIVFNGENIFLTGMLHWGMYWDIMTPACSPEQVRKEITELKKAGFNAVKFCLVVPPEYVLDIYDEMGMYVYIEYPIWNPSETDDFYRRAYLQMMDMVKRDRNHPSLIMSDFNCEMPSYTREADALMKWCVEEAKRIAPNRLYMDNSSCGIQKYGDFTATHPYNQLNNFEKVVEAWVEYRTRDADKPVVFGEYADIEVMRDLVKLQKDMDPDSVWYHEYFGAVDSAALMREYGFTEEQIEYTIASSLLNAQEIKKAYIEASKTNPKMAGLFVTHITDLENQTAFGFFDDAGTTRFDPKALAQSAGETVLLLGRQTQNFWAGSTAGFTARLSHYNGQDITKGELKYRLLDGGRTVSEKTLLNGLALENGDYYELIKFTVQLPDSDQTVRYSLELVLTDNGKEIARNAWDIWAYPTGTLDGLSGLDIRVYDPSNKLGLLGKYSWMKEWRNGFSEKPDLIVTTAMPSSIMAYLNLGGKVLYIGAGDGPVPVVEEWLYNRNVFSFLPDKGNPVAASLANEGYGALQFLELATRYHMDYSAYAGHVGTPIIGKYNYTSNKIGAYVAEFNIGMGHLIQSTLRHDSRELRLGTDIFNYYTLHVDAYENVIGTYLLEKLIAYQVSK